MKTTWPLQDAKARFSELFSLVCEVGPQRVTRRGKEAIIMIAESEYATLNGQKGSFVEFLLSGPKLELNMQRTRDFGRAIEL